LIEKKNLKVNEKNKRLFKRPSMKYEYNKDSEATRIFNDFLVEKGGVNTLLRERSKGLQKGDTTMKRSVKMRKFRNLLAEKENPWATRRQREVENLLNGCYYGHNLIDIY
jgi:hypothetical protein